MRQTSIEDVIEAFDLLDDWEDRYSFIIDLGKQLPPMDVTLKTESSLVKGCVSQVWLVSHLVDKNGENHMHYIADSDAFIVKGLIAILFAIFQDKTPWEIANTSLPEIFKRLSLEKHLSPNRRNGFYAVIERIKQDAQNYI